MTHLDRSTTLKKRFEEFVLGFERQRMAHRLAQLKGLMVVSCPVVFMSSVEDVLKVGWKVRALRVP